MPVDLLLVGTGEVIRELGLPLFLVFLGSLLVLAEVFIPSGGAIGLASAACFLGGVAIAFVRTYQMGVPVVGWLFCLGVVILVPILVVGGFRMLPHTPLGRKIILDGRPQKEAPLLTLPADELVGATGVAMTDLRPAGAAEVGGRIVDVVTEGEYVEKGRPLRVVRVEGNRVMVQETTDTGPPSS